MRSPVSTNPSLVTISVVSRFKLELELKSGDGVELGMSCKLRRLAVVVRSPSLLLDLHHSCPSSLGAVISSSEDDELDSSSWLM